MTPPPTVGPESTWIGVVVSALLLLGSIGACLVTGIAVSEASEGDAMAISMFTVPTLIAGLFPWIVALFTPEAWGSRSALRSAAAA